MPPEDSPPKPASEVLLQENEWDGPWGSISAVPHSVETLCVQIDSEKRKSRVYYFPYRTIGKWHWNVDIIETLEVHSGSIQIVVTGTNLRRFAEALNIGQLRLLKLNHPPDVTGTTVVRSILINN